MRWFPRGRRRRATPEVFEFSLRWRVGPGTSQLVADQRVQLLGGREVGRSPEKMVVIFKGESGTPKMAETFRFSVFLSNLSSNYFLTRMILRYLGHFGRGPTNPQNLGDENDHHGPINHWTNVLGAHPPSRKRIKYSWWKESCTGWAWSFNPLFTGFLHPRWLTWFLNHWRIIPLSKWFVTPMYKPQTGHLGSGV